MARQLTDIQLRTLRFIYDYIKRNGCAPTHKEIGKIYLAHSSSDMIDKHYVPESYDKLAQALEEMRLYLQPMFDGKN